MSRLGHWLQPAPTGADKTSDPTTLPETSCIRMVNLFADRAGILRGQVGLSDLFSSFLNQIDGVGYLYQAPVTYSGASSPSTPPPPVMAIVSGGEMYTYEQNTPLTFPPTFNTTPLDSSPGFIHLSPVQFANFGSEMFAFQKHNAYVNWRIQNDGTITVMGMVPETTSFTASSPSGSNVKSGVVYYSFCYLDNEGRLSSPYPTPYKVDYGTTLAPGDLLSNTIPVDYAMGTGNIVSVQFLATTGGGSVFYQIGSPQAGVAGNTVTLQDIWTDAQVSAFPIAPNFGENDPALPAQYGVLHKARLVLNVTDTNQIQISNLGSPVQFNSQGVLFDPTTGAVSNASDGFTLSVGTNQADMVLGFVSLGSVLVIFCEFGIYLLQGTDLSDFIVNKISDIGCCSPGSIVRCENVVMYQSFDGFIYMIDDTFNVTKISQPIDADIQPVAATAAGMASIALSVACYANKRYHLQIPNAATPSIYFYDMNLPGQIKDRWGELSLTSPGVAQTQLQISCVATPTPLDQPTYIIVGTYNVTGSGTFSVSLIDEITPNQTVNGMLYVTAPIQTLLPYRQRAEVGEQEIRAARKRIRKAQVFGSGTLTAGGTISCYADGRLSEQYPLPTTPLPGPLSVDGYLAYQEWTPANTGRLTYLALAINGTGIEISNISNQYEFVG